MATVKNEASFFDGKPWRYVIKFTAKTGLFTLTVPMALSEKLGIGREISGDTLLKVETEWHRRVREYTAASTVTRKVIAWNLEISARIWPQGDDLSAGPVLERDEIHFTSGLALALAVGVFEQHTTTSDGRVSVRYTPLESDLPRSISVGGFDHSAVRDGGIGVMDWTPEREMFFIRISQNFETLILRLSDFLGIEASQVNKLETFIDGGGNLLPPTV